MKIVATFMSGAGNLFTAIDNRFYNFTIDQLKKLAPLICKTNDINSFKTEGLLVIQNSSEAGLDFTSEFLNPDGSHGAMCGNGGRCAVRYAIVNSIINNNKKSLNFKMAGEIYKSKIKEDMISIFFPPPKSIMQISEFKTESKIFFGYYVNVGSEHFVINKSLAESLRDIHIYDIDLDELAKPIRYHSIFEPNGVNVNLYAIENDTIILRTFERGVEAETGACGTGAISTALVANLTDCIKLPVKIIPPSRIPIYVDVLGEIPNNIKSIILTGPAEIIETKEMIIDIEDEI